MPDRNNVEHSVHAEMVMPLIMERLAAGQSVKNLTFQGVSMLPMLRQGKDAVEIAPLPERLEKYDLPVYKNAAGKYVMHRIVGVKDGCYICIGDNTWHYEKVLPGQMVAVVRAFSRNGRWISVENPGYRAYCRVWRAVFPLRLFYRRIQWRIKAVVRKMAGR